MSETADPPLRLSGLTVMLGPRTALDAISVEVRAGELVAVCGPNGAGKSTLLRAAMGLVRPAAGEASLFGRAAFGQDPLARARLAAYLPQERHIAWGLSAKAIVALGALHLSDAEAERRAAAALDLVEMAHAAERSVTQLSGGERARVLLARMLAAQAPFMALDEPVAGLDPAAQLKVLQLLRSLAQGGAAIVVSLHDLNLCARFADRVVLLSAGRLIACAEPLEALCPENLAEVFRLEAEWVATPRGHRLEAACAL